MYRPCVSRQATTTRTPALRYQQGSVNWPSQRVGSGATRKGGTRTDRLDHGVKEDSLLRSALGWVTPADRQASGTRTRSALPVSTKIAISWEIQCHQMYTYTTEISCEKQWIASLAINLTDVGRRWAQALGHSSVVYTA